MNRVASHQPLPDRALEPARRVELRAAFDAWYLRERLPHSLCADYTPVGHSLDVATSCASRVHRVERVSYPAIDRSTLWSLHTQRVYRLVGVKLWIVTPLSVHRTVTVSRCHVHSFSEQAVQVLLSCYVVGEGLVDRSRLPALSVWSSLYNKPERHRRVVCYHVVHHRTQQVVLSSWYSTEVVRDLDALTVVQVSPLVITLAIDVDEVLLGC